MAYETFALRKKDFLFAFFLKKRNFVPELNIHNQ
ncbi:hypothetical protein EZS27_007725 [termite gut metagenome]|uniref:Uncharacterized protein n=1 Tax=termite gut metagenome TaxID=433724 RepID=A0A5J4SES7_9ZZZZ